MAEINLKKTQKIYDNVLKEKVMVTELLGSEVHVHVGLDNEIDTLKIEAPTDIKTGDIIPEFDVIGPMDDMKEKVEKPHK